MLCKLCAALSLCCSLFLVIITSRYFTSRVFDFVIYTHHCQYHSSLAVERGWIINLVKCSSEWVVEFDNIKLGRIITIRQRCWWRKGIVAVSCCQTGQIVEWESSAWMLNNNVKSCSIFHNEREVEERRYLPVRAWLHMGVPGLLALPRASSGAFGPVTRVLWWHWRWCQLHW